MRKVKISIPRIVAFSAACLLSVAAVALGVILLMANTIVNISFVFAYMVIPAVCVIFSALLIFSDMKPVKKTLFVLLGLSVLVYVFVEANRWGLFEMLDYHEGESVSQYESVPKAFSCMPNLSDVGEPEKVEYYDYFSQQGIFFTCDTDVLICRYAESEYPEQKAIVLDAYVFQQEPLIACGYSCESTAQIDGYCFRMLAVSDNYGEELYFPKRMVFVATNDQTNEIVYMSFCDDDLDYIDSLTDFILYTCGWTHMR